MAPLRITGVVSCSSEDKVCCAKNLLVADSFKKWATEKPGITNASVILQLESEQSIIGVDIGNNGASFIEVLVANSADDGGPTDYHNLVITSAFMSPSESRSQANRYKLRMFSKEELCKPALEKKWDRIKIVCTQPYNKNIPFGVSVVTLHGPSAPQPKCNDTPLKIFIPEKPSITSHEITPEINSAQKKNNNSDVSSESKAASQLLSKLHQDQCATSSDAMKRLKESSQKGWSQPSRSIIDITDENEDNKTPGSYSKKLLSPQGSSDKTPRSIQKKDFSRLLNDVVFVLSGFQNPLRSDIREIGLSMGGQYRPDWTSDATHLICSVANTPKFNQVKGKGIIVAKEWVFDCKKEKRKIAENKYRLDQSQTLKPSKSSSESEIEEVDEKSSGDSEIEEVDQKHSKRKLGKAETDIPSKRKKNNSENDSDLVPSQTISSADDDESVKSMEQLELGAIKDELDSPTKPSLPDISDSESEADEASFDNETDDETETDIIKRLGLPSLPDIFSGHRFFLHSESFETSEEIKQVNRYLVAYGGKVYEHMCSQVKFIVTKSDCWMPSFHQALSNNSQIKFLHSSWVEESSSKLLALDKSSYYIVNSNAGS